MEVSRGMKSDDDEDDDWEYDSELDFDGCDYCGSIDCIGDCDERHDYFEDQ